MRRELLTSFHERKNTFVSGSSAFLLTALDSGDGLRTFKITAEEVQSCFDTAYRSATELIKKQIIELASLEKRCKVLRVIVGGGSSNHSMVHEWLDKLCHEYGITVLYFGKVAVGGDEQ